jgi:HlyD family secretion protein
VPNSALRFRLPGDDSVPVRGSGPGLTGGGAPQSAEQVRERLTQSLRLTAEQQKKLEPILQDTGQKMRGLAARGLADSERRLEAQRIREASREQIRTILTPEQRAKYDSELSEAQLARQGAASGRVFTLGQDGKPTPVVVQTGITDGNFTEILGGDLKDGQDLITGVADASGTGRTNAGPRLRL